MAFKIGDRVQLNSGSPIMTVTGPPKDSQGGQLINCTWFDGYTERQGTYPAEALAHYVQEQAPEPEDDGDFITR